MMLRKQTACLTALIVLSAFLLTACGEQPPADTSSTTSSVVTQGENQQPGSSASITDTDGDSASQGASSTTLVSGTESTQGNTDGHGSSSSSSALSSRTDVAVNTSNGSATQSTGAVTYSRPTRDTTTATVFGGSTVTCPTTSKAGQGITNCHTTNTTATVPPAATTVSNQSVVNPSDATTTIAKPTMPAVTQETPPAFSVGFITTEKTYIETDYVIFEIDPNIYVIGDLAQKTDTMCAAMEKVTGLSFKTKTYNAKKTFVHVGRSYIVGEEEVGDVAHAKSGYFSNSRGDTCANYVYLNPMELFLGKGTTFLHEMAHVLRFCQTEVGFRTVFEEGFAVFTEYQTIQYLKNHHTDVAYALDAAIMPIYSIPIDEDLYSQSIETWLKKDFEYDTFANNAYAIGYRFLEYLKDCYGDPFKWIAASSGQEALVSAETTIATLKSCYGNTALSKFYTWMKQHEKDFEVDGSVYTPNTGEVREMSGFAPISFYPRFLSSYNEAPVSYLSFRYKDLYINLEEVKRYLSEYKGRNVDNCYLSLSHPATVLLYDKQGKVLDAVNDQKIPVKGVSYIKLVGSGYMGCMHLDGYHKPSDTFNTPTVFYEKTIEANGGSDVVYYALNEIMMRSDLEIRVVASSPLTNISFEAVYWENFTSYENVSQAAFVGGCRTISLFNHTDKDVTVKVIAAKK